MGRERSAWVWAMAGALLLGGSGLRPQAGRAAGAMGRFTATVRAVPNPVRAGAVATISVHTRIGAVCEATISYDGGGGARPPSLGTGRAGGSGILRWSRRIGAGVAGSARIRAVCSWKGERQGGWTVLRIAGTAPTAAIPRPAGTPAVLGASLADFVRRLGPIMPNTSTMVAGWMPCPDNMGATLLVTFGDYAQGIDGQLCGEASMAPALRLGESARYMPPGSERIGDVRGNYGPDALYRSAWLAARGTTGDWRDCDGNAVPAGTFILDLHSSYDRGWQLAYGSCPSN